MSVSLVHTESFKTGVRNVKVIFMEYLIPSTFETENTFFKKGILLEKKRSIHIHKFLNFSLQTEFCSL